MLPAALVRARVRGGALAPLRPDRDDPPTVDVAERVHQALTAAAEARARMGAVQAELDEIAEDHPDPKLARGIVHTAVALCETGASEVTDPSAFRLEVFHHAARTGPIGLSADGPRPTAAAVLAEFARARGLAPERASDDLYADLPLERRVISYEGGDPTRLLQRTEVGQVQSLLASAAKIRVALQGPSVPRMRQLVRWIKFFRLLHTARIDGGSLELELDGPMSLFGASSRYGVALASFFPALLLQECPWTLHATVAWKKGPARPLTITSDDGYVSHYADTGAYHTKVHEHFAGRFAEAERDFALVEGALPLQLAERDVLFPDYTLVHTSGAQVHLEILGHWQPDRLARRLGAVEAAGERRLVLAVGRKLTVSTKDATAVPDHPQVVPYSEVLSVEKVLAAARRCLDR